MSLFDMDELARKVSLAADAFRLGQVGVGGNTLTMIIDALLPLIETNLLNKKNVSSFNVIIQNIIQAQLRGDYLYLADLLEYDLLSQLDCDVYH